MIPFVTHGGYGLGNTESVLARHAPKPRWLKGFVMQADPERRTMERVTDWLKGVTVGCERPQQLIDRAAAMPF